MPAISFLLFTLILCDGLSFETLYGEFGHSQTNSVFQRNSVEIICVNADEVLAASGHDVGLEVFFAEKVQHLEHRLVNEFSVGTCAKALFPRELN
jgi:hypothetical protein